MIALVADDNNVIQKIFSKHLSQLGCAHIPIWNGRDVLDYLANPSNPRPNVIFIKFSMPVMGGLETITILRTQPPFSTDPALRAIPIIGTSPLTLQIDRERYMSKYPMDDMMRRPAKLADLRRVLLRWSRTQFAPGGGFRPVWGPFPLRGYKGPRSLL